MPNHPNLPSDAEVAAAVLKSLKEYLTTHKTLGTPAEVYTHAFLAGTAYGGLAALDYLTGALATLKNPMKNPSERVN